MYLPIRSNLLVFVFIYSEAHGKKSHGKNAWQRMANSLLKPDVMLYGVTIAHLFEGICPQIFR